jgi:restriction endonuclease S subunit
MNTFATRKLKYVATPQSIKVPYEATDRRYIGLENIQSWTGRLTVDELTEPEGTVSLFETGDVLFGKLRPYLAKVLLAVSPGACSTEALVLRPRPIYWPPFLRYVLSEKRFIDEVDASTFGAKMPRASWDFIGGRQVRLPDLDTQKAIVIFLDRQIGHVDQLIEKKERLLDLLNAKKAQVISDAVRHGLDNTVPTKSVLGAWSEDVPIHWQPIPLKYLFRQRKRQGHSDLEVLSVYRDYGVIVKASRDDNINRTPEDLSLYQLVNPGDLVVNKMKAWQGSLGISTFQGITSPDYMVFEPIVPQYPRFIHYYLRAQPMPFVYRSMSNGIRPDQWRIEPEKFREVVVWLPSFDEQIAISAFIDEETARIENLIHLTAISVERLREHRAALITAAVSGQIDVHQQPVAVTIKANRARFRVIVGAEIVQHHQGNAKFGRVKLQKELYLAEAHAGIKELQGTYLREAAGPLDRALVDETEGGLEAFGFFRTVLPNIHAKSSGVVYAPLSKAGQHRAELEALLGPRADALRRLIGQLRDFDTRAVEAIATLYAAWNDALIDGEAPDDDAIVRAVLNDWHPEKREKFKDADLRHWLAWMKRNALVPNGKGARTISTIPMDMFA